MPESASWAAVASSHVVRLCSASAEADRSPVSQPEKTSISYSPRHLRLQPAEEIIGFEIEVSGGGFESISSLPKGWRIAIDNKSVLQTRLSADLAFGSERMNAAQMQDVVVTLSSIELENQTFRVTGHLLVTNGASERRLSLTSQNFVPR